MPCWASCSSAFTTAWQRERDGAVRRVTSGRAASDVGQSATRLGKPKARMEAARRQNLWLIRGVPRGGILGKGPHRLAQPVFPLQVPKHILGAVGPVLLLQVPQEDPGGCRERRQGRKSLEPPHPLPSGSPQRQRPSYLQPQLPPDLYSWPLPPPNSESRTLRLLGATAPSGDGKGGPYR